MLRGRKKNESLKVIFRIAHIFVGFVNYVDFKTLVNYQKEMPKYDDR